jgi:predicted transcriptional regulator
MPTRAEVAAIRKGRAAIKRGEFVTLEKLLHDMDNPRRKARAKKSVKSSR